LKGARKHREGGILKGNRSKDMETGRSDCGVISSGEKLAKKTESLGAKNTFRHTES